MCARTLNELHKRIVIVIVTSVVLCLQDWPLDSASAATEMGDDLDVDALLEEPYLNRDKVMCQTATVFALLPRPPSVFCAYLMIP